MNNELRKILRNRNASDICLGNLYQNIKIDLVDGDINYSQNETIVLIKISQDFYYSPKYNKGFWSSPWEEQEFFVTNIRQFNYNELDKDFEYSKHDMKRIYSMCGK